jgi:hypothetical protein
MLEEKGHNKDARMLNDASEQCRTFVVACMARVKHARPSLFRSYPAGSSFQKMAYIWEACRATTALSPWFPSILVKHDIIGMTYENDLACSNPSELALEEARELWSQDRPFALSILEVEVEHSPCITLIYRIWNRVGRPTFH